MSLPNHRKGDLHFVDSLRNEHLSEFFSYCVDGASKWYAAGRLPEHAKISAATNKIIAQNDTVTAFIEAELVVDEKEHVETQNVYGRYSFWGQNNSERELLISNTLTRQMARRFVKKQSKVKGVKVTRFWGFRLKTDAEKMEEEDSVPIR